MASGRSPMPSSSSHSRRRTSSHPHPQQNNNNNNNDTSANHYYSSSSLFTTPSNNNHHHLLTTPSTFSPPKRRSSSSFMMDPLFTAPVVPPIMTKPMTTTTTIPNTTTTTTTKQEEEEEGVQDELVEMRQLVDETCRYYHPKLAIPYASLLYTKSKLVQDGILLAQICIQSQQYTRALSILQHQLLPSNNNNTTTTTTNSNHLQITTLIATCFMECKNYEEALTILESYQHDTTTTIHKEEEEWLHQLLVSNNKNNSREMAWYCCQRGICLEEMGNPIRAAFFFMKSLQFHVTCQLSWKMLCDKQLLSQSQLYQFLTNDLIFTNKHSWLQPFYLTQLSTTTTTTIITKHDDEGDRMVQEEDFLPNQSPNHTNNNIHETMTKYKEQKNNDDGERMIQDAFEMLEIKHDLKIKDSPELSSLAAIRAYEQNDLKTALYYCQQNPQQTTGTALFVHVSTLTALQHKRSLFALAHKLVHATSTTTINTGEEAAIAWYAVGCYYYSCQKYELAQRNFCRATRLAPKRAECWIAFGCSFSIVDESDQALASYRAAQKYTPSSPLPFLYMAMEYMRTNHSSLAKHFFTTAQSLSSSIDNNKHPLLYNELGVWYYKQQDYTQAITYFQQALSSSSSSEQEFWEPTMFNLGQSYRKSKQYTNALECFENCISTCPGKASGYSALGFIHHLLGNMDDAIEQYHLALSRKPDDTFASEMLYRALQEAIQLPNENDNSLLLSSSNQKQQPSKSMHHTMMNMSATMISTTTPRLNKHHHTPIQQDDNNEEQFSNFTFDHSDVDISMT